MAAPKVTYLTQRLTMRILNPLAKSRKGKTPVIIKFVKRSTRKLVFSNKKLLVKSGLALIESLTKKRLDLVYEAKKWFKNENVWTINGNIFCFICVDNK